MAFPNIDLLLTNRTDTLVQVAKAFTDYTEAGCHLAMNTYLSSFFYITRQVVRSPSVTLYRVGPGFRTSETSAPS